MVDQDDIAWKLLNSMQGEVSLPELIDILDERTATPKEAQEYINKIGEEHLVGAVKERCECPRLSSISIPS